MSAALHSVQPIVRMLCGWCGHEVKNWLCANCQPERAQREREELLRREAELTMHAGEL